MKSFFKILSIIFVFTLLTVAGALGYAYYFLTTGDGKLPSQVIYQIENSINKISPEYKVFISNAEVNWSGLNNPLKLSLKNAYIRKGDETISTAPEIDAELNVKKLLLGKVNFQKVTVLKPELILNDNNELNANLDQSQELGLIEVYQKSLVKFIKNIQSGGNVIPFEKLEFIGSKINSNYNGKNNNWVIKYADLRFFELQNSFYLKSKVESVLLGKETAFDTEVRLTKNNSINFKTNFKSFPSRLIAGLLPKLNWLGKVNSFTSGDADVVIDETGRPTSISVSSEIEFEDKNFLNSKIVFEGGLTTSKISDKLIPTIFGKTTIKEIPMNNLSKIWPENIGGAVRRDVLTNYRDGLYDSVEISFNAVSKDEIISSIEDLNFAIKGQISDATIKFYESYPELQKVKGNFIYDGNNVDLVVESANMGNSVFSDSKIKLLDLQKDKGTIIQIEGDVEGGIDDLKPLLSAIFEGKDKDYFYNKIKINSAAKTKFYYRDDITQPFETELVKLDVTSDITDVKIDNIFQDINLTSPKLLFKITEKGVELSGGANLNNSPADIDFKYNFFSDISYELKFIAEVPEKIILENAPDLKDYMKGSIQLELNVVNKNQTDFITGKIDLANAKISVPILSWLKDAGEYGLISFYGQSKDGQLIFDDFQIISSNVVTSGNAKFTLSGEANDEINFTNLNFARNNANLTLKRTNITLPPNATGKRGILSASNYDITVTGNTFDFESYLKNTGYSEQPFGLNLKVKTNKAYLANGVEMRNVNANLNCVIEYCLNAKASANFATNGSINLEYKPKTENIYGEREFNFGSDNAEDFLKGVDVTTNVRGGSIAISSSVNAAGKQESNGSIGLYDFKLAGTPILAKIVSLASITGILDLLQGEGLSFKKLKGNFEMLDYLVSVKNFRAAGGSLGMTAEGIINLKNSTANISGAVTPAYSVNSVFGNVPYIGKLLTGKEGEGIIATRYSVKGKYADPDVGVNPFSMITPGFLRNIWGDSDTNLEQELEKENASAKSNESAAHNTGENIAQQEVNTSIPPQQAQPIQSENKKKDDVNSNKKKQPKKPLSPQKRKTLNK